MKITTLHQSCGCPDSAPDLDNKCTVCGVPYVEAERNG